MFTVLTEDLGFGLLSVYSFILWLETPVKRVVLWQNVAGLAHNYLLVMKLSLSIYHHFL